MSVLSVIIILAGLIIVHEAGHFIAATSQRIRIHGFSIGFGPALLKRRRYGVNFALRLIPLGGFISFPDTKRDKLILDSDPDLLSNRSILQRSIVIIAGVFANICLAWAVLISQGILVGLPTSPGTGVLVTSVQPNQPGDIAGLRSGDVILSISGHHLDQGEKAVSELVEYIRNAPEETLKVTRKIHNQSESLLLRPVAIEGVGHVGVQLQANFNSIGRPAKNPREIFKYANNEVIGMLTKTIFSYGELITNFSSAASDISGPIKIVEVGSFMIKQGGISVFVFTSLISVNLAVLNALPLPLLDGGQLLLLLIESLRGEPLPKKIENIFMQTGVIAFLGITLILFVHDTLQLNVIKDLFE
uniref:Peptidase M50, putative membrane-associated zinc metallopeptidase n=1 Tax=Paulinella longichromatophora TaxID=1708747 RepID=A0A2H4ZNU6_9EUKA|nr:Peptidase M50, putative membrane-associated zinc metallopeptidase [Paulinella longichromatophora]